MSMLLTKHKDTLTPADCAFTRPKSSDGWREHGSTLSSWRRQCDSPNPNSNGVEFDEVTISEKN